MSERSSATPDELGRFRAALRRAPVVLFTQDRDLRYTWVSNPVFASADDLLGKTDADLLPPSSAAALTEIKAGVLRTGVGVRREVWLETPVGVKHYDLSVEPTPGPDGRVDGVACTALDITERVEAETARRASEERLRAVFDQTLVGIAEVDLTGRFVRVNRRYCQVVGRTAEELYALRMHDITHPDDLARNQPLFEQAVAGGTPFVIEKRYVRPDGAVVWVSNSVSLIRGERGEPRSVVAASLDVSDRRQAEEALRRNADTFSGLVRNSPFGVYIVDADFRLREVSAGARKVFAGIDPLIGRDFAEVLRIVWEEPFAGEAIRLFRHTLATGEPYHAPTTTERRHNINAVESYDWKVERIALPDGRPGVVCHFYDLSERRRYEAALRASEERFRLAADAVNGIIYEYDPRTGRVERTRGLSEVLGYQPHEVPPTGLWWWEQLHPDDRPALAALAAGATPDRAVTEYRVRHKDGRWLHVEDRAVVLRDADGTPVRMVGCTVDVTDRKLAEVSLREQSALTRTITDNATTAIFMMDDRSRCTFMNPAAERMTGFTFAEVEGRILHDLIHHHHPDGRPYPMADCPIDRALPEGFDVVGHEDVFVRKSGEFFPVRVNAKPIRQGGAAAGTVIEVRDVTAEKRAEEANAGLVEQLRQADRRKDEFVATLAHELRNPLAPVRNAVQVLMAKGPPDPDLVWSRQVIDRQVRVMARLLDDLLDVSRVSRDKLDLRRERVDLAAVVAAAVETSRPLIDAGGHHLAVALPGEPVVLDADPVRLSQVFANLLNNAAKYTDRGGHIRLTAERAGDAVAVTVADDGIGLSADVIPRLFEIFAQAGPALDRSQGGLGIGLALVRGLVELHGGTIEAHSDGPGRGSAFTVRLPAVAPPRPAPPPPPPPPRQAAKCRLLIADDLRDSADSLALLLTVMGHEVRTAYDGEHAVAAAGEFRPDVVLLDLGMPKVSGYDACRRIRQEPWGRGVCLVAVTGWGQEEDRRRTAEAGFDHHLVKPVATDDLMALLATLAATPRVSG